MKRASVKEWWEDLPPLDPAELPEFPRESEPRGTTVTIEVGIGSFLPDPKATPGAPVDLGKAIATGLAQVLPSLAGMAKLGTTDFDALTEGERIEALVDLGRQRAWLTPWRTSCWPRLWPRTRLRRCGRLRKSPAR